MTRVGVRIIKRTSRRKGGRRSGSRGSGVGERASLAGRYRPFGQGEVREVRSHAHGSVPPARGLAGYCCCRLHCCCCANRSHCQSESVRQSICNDGMFPTEGAIPCRMIASVARSILPYCSLLFVLSQRGGSSYIVVTESSFIPCACADREPHGEISE